MSCKNFIRVVCVSGIVVALGGVTAFGLPTLQNGDFSAGLNSWVVESGTVIDGGGHALFFEDVVSSTLSQEFWIPSKATKLSFTMLMLSMGTSGDYNPLAGPDVFTISLYDNPTNLNPLVSNPGVDNFYYRDNTGYLETVAMVIGSRISLDVSGLSSMNAYLVFDLLGSDDGMTTKIYLDNVEVCRIPAPRAMLLGFIGMGMVGLWIRSQKEETGRQKTGTRRQSTEDKDRR